MRNGLYDRNTTHRRRSSSADSGRHQSGDVATERMERDDRHGLMRWVGLAVVEGDSPADGKKRAGWACGGAMQGQLCDQPERGTRQGRFVALFLSRLSAAVSRPNPLLVSGEALSAIDAE